MEWLNILVVLSVFCVLKCSSMTNNELEDFVDFLQKTSRLDQVLKKGAEPDEDFDADELIPEHAWEDSGKFEGDLILNDRQRRVIVEDVAEGLSRNGLKDTTKRWPDNEVVYYIQKEHFNSDQMQAIMDGIEDLGQASCIKFRPYQRGDKDAVVIQGSRRGCFSQVGYQGGYQLLNLNARHPPGRGCFRHGTVIHELLHTLGFYHMQSSPDRDDYVDIVWDNIHQGARNNFRKYNSFAVSDFGVGYDYDSVLHYSRRAFSINGQDTIVPKQNGAQIGQRSGLSDKDTKKLNRMYCDAEEAAEEAPQKKDTKKEIPKEKTPKVEIAKEETAKEETTKEDTPKNKPFQGHGIGYHQGKALVIKLLPAAETFPLKDKPIHTFDYFSKTPQEVSSSKIEEPGRHIKKTDKLPKYVGADFHNDLFHKYSTSDLFNDLFHKDSTGNLSVAQEGKAVDIDNPKRQYHINEQSKISKQEALLSHEVTPSKPNKDVEEVDDDLTNVFEKLGKVIRNYENPNHYFKKYNINTDYKEFYPQRRSDTLNEDHKEDIPDRVSDLRVIQNNAKLAATFIDSLYDLKTEPVERENRVLQHANLEIVDDFEKSPFDAEVLKSFRTSYLTRHLKPHIPSPKYVKPANLRNRHDFSSLYDVNSEENDDEDYTKRKYKLFGEEVPLYDPWFKNHENREESSEAKNIDAYSKEESSLETENQNEFPNPYKLIDSVPFTENWYNDR